MLGRWDETRGRSRWRWDLDRAIYPITVVEHYAFSDKRRSFLDRALREVCVARELRPSHDELDRGRDDTSPQSYEPAE